MRLPDRVLRPVVKRAALLLALPLLALPLRAQDEAPPPRSAALLQSSMLSAHNAERATVGAPPLVWDAALANDAAVWARSLARSGNFVHSPVEIRGAGQGENLWMGTARAYAYGDMIAMWTEEKARTRSGRFPDVSSTGNWHDVGHYTQIIWPSTTKLGCAMASGRGDDYLVCRYGPAGNRVGETVVIK
jgi:Cysteine-rich secretory protein family